jgi:glycosyltransferase involved in cell wall biosynthesis
MAGYQVTIVELVDNFLVLAPMLPAPVVVDLDDRESDVIGQVRSKLRDADKRRRPGLVGSAVGLPRKVARDSYLAVERFRWLRAERSVIRRADSFLVASPEDALTTGAPAKAVVFPNGFELGGAPAGSRGVHTPPTIAFWGLISYGPNREGAQWLLDEVLPRLTKRIPDVRTLIIGRGSELLNIPSHGRVVATGFVEDLSVLLSETDVAVVPLLVGGGTRIKIIEAWANNLPVVSTARGAYGLGAINGENVLLADDPEAFARAIALTLGDFSLRDRLIENGAARAKVLSWSRIEMDLGEHLVRVAVSGSSR